ncbi:hypothetical protein L3X38_011784 [Prunus dulcis]|uniref:U-box domain-containing protein n=1 Tax=Prunus dulcis TaxID=3755 RepID=A0AAD4WI04_PRUDU|nr:hypothetical protein L3X38_011784 [Prunus dulcis]
MEGVFKKELQRLVRAIFDGEDFSTQPIDQAKYTLSALKELKFKKRSLSLKLNDVLSCPQEFRCPLSKDLMKDPVIVSTGERKNADIYLSYDKLLAGFHAYHKSARESKFEATMDAYKLHCLDCKNGYAPLYAIGDEDMEEFYPDLPYVQSEQVNAANMEKAEE